MAKTIEVAGTVKYENTAGIGAILGPSLVKSITVLEQQSMESTLATAGTLTISFAAVVNAKILVIKVSAGPVTVTVTVNAVASGNIRVNDLFMLVDTGGGITAAAVTQSTGSDVTVETFIAGST